MKQQENKKKVGLIIGAVAKLIRLLSRVPGMGFLKGVANAADKAAVAVGKTGESIEKLANKKITTPKIPSITGGAKPGTTTGIVGNVTNKDTAGKSSGSGKETVQYVTVYASDTNDIARKLARSAKHGIPVGAK